MSGSSNHQARAVDQPAGRDARGDAAGEPDLFGDATSDGIGMHVGGELLGHLRLGEPHRFGGLHRAVTARSFSNRAIRSIRTASETATSSPTTAASSSTITSRRATTASPDGGAAASILLEY